MNKRFGVAVAMGLALSQLALMAQAKVGQAAPDFSGTDINGRTHRLADYRGKIVVLEAFNPDCPFCGNQYRSGALPALQSRVVSKGVVWFVVNSAPENSPSYRKPDAARKVFADMGIKATAWLDDHAGQLGKAYGMRTTPHVFVINPQGLLVYQGAVDDRPESTGDPKTANNYVRGAIEALMAGRPVATAETKPYGSPVRY